MGTPRYDYRMFNPPALFREVTNIAGEFPLAPPVRVHGEFSLGALDRQVDWLHQATLHLLEHHPVDVFMVVENYTDHVQHFFHRSRVHLQNGQAVDVVERAHVAADALIGSVVERIGEETPLLVLSDHGFTRLEGFVNLGVALEAEKGAETERVAALWSLWNVIRRVLPAGLSEGIRRRVKRARPELHVGGVGSYGSLLGAVADLEALARRLDGIRHPDTGEPMVTFYRRAELYQGGAIESAPVGVAFPAPGWQTKLTAAREGALLDGPRWLRDHEGTHALDGLIVAANFPDGEPLPTALEDVLLFCLRAVSEVEASSALVSDL
jgi:predicted AlkP superfamily phosphohydrolase/phosphomutase